MDDPGAFEALLNHTLDKLAVIDEDGVYTYVNGAARRMLGYEPSELVGEPALDYVHPDDRTAVEETFGSLVDAPAGVTGTGEYRYRGADGSYVWLESRMSSASVAALDGYVVSSRDVTDRKAAEAERLESERRFSSIAANANDVLWMSTPDWEETLFVNDAFEDIWGMPTERLREDPTAFLEGVHPDDREKVREAMAHLSEGHSINLEYRINASQGYRRWVWVQGEPVFEDGEVTEVVGFARDVTDRRRREQHLKSIDHLLRHNVRNDMNVVMGNADLARRLTGDERAACLDRIVDVSEELLSTVEKERTIVRFLTEPPSPVPLDLGEEVRCAAADVRRAFPSADVTVDCPDPVEVRTLPAVAEAVRELLENAARHCPDEAVTVTATVRPTAGGAEVTVRDDGPPIPQGEIEVVLGRREMDQLHHGSGLGLWLVYWVVDLAGGDISFERPDGGGNLVRLALPDG